MTGHVLFANGWSASSFARSDRSLPPHWSDPMGTRLKSLGEAVGTRLPVTSPVLRRVVEASHRLLAAQNEDVDPAGRLLLTVGVIADAASWASGPPRNWHEFAEQFDAAWAEWSLQEHLFRVVSNAVGHSSERYLDEDERDQLQLLRSKIIADQPDGTFLLDMRRACENVPALAGLYPVGCGEGRQLATLEQHLANGPSLARHLLQLSDGYRRLLARTVRCRNAVAHGGPLPAYTVESVLSWARELATSLRNAGMDALLTGSAPDPRADIAEVHRRTADAAQKCRTALGRGDDIAETLFATYVEDET